MDWSTNENGTNLENSTNQHIDEFSNLNLNQLSQFISLNPNQVLITNDLINSNKICSNTNNISSQSNNDSEILVKNHIENEDKSNNLSHLLLLSNKNDKLIEMSLTNQDHNNLFSIPLTTTSDSVFISDLLSTNTNFSNEQIVVDNLQNQELNSSSLSLSSLETSIISNTKKLNLNRYNYKCNHCLHLTKFKAHIIEHMLIEHKIDLMQCPYINCSKKFKDEWKLKRHLISNKEHIKIGTFRDLNDCLKQHVIITPQKIGQYPCPLCQVDPLTGDVIILNNFDQQTSITNLLNKNIDNSLYFDKYDELKEHVSKQHSNFDIDSYYICKQCGQVFLSRYKLNCHQFNVHSGKRRPKAKSNHQNNSINSLLNIATNNQNQIETIGNNDNISSIIDSVAKGFGLSELNLSNRNMQHRVINQIQDRKLYSCIICIRKFKRARDLQTHVHIMHKNLSEEQKENLRVEIDQTTQTIKSLKSRRKFLNNQSTTNILNKSSSSLSLMTIASNDSNTKMCFICNKIFRAVSNSVLNPTPGITNTLNLNKSFQRHLQLQHGINEKGEKLIDCPVCEKSFFSKIQLERHIRTHQEWILNETDSKTSASDLNTTIAEYRDKHSILYCHECVECKIYFKSIKILTKHKKDAHNLKPVYKCANTAECNQQFDSIEQFLEHSKVHSQRNIICTKCKLKFNHKNNLRLHMKNVHYKVSMSTKTQKSNKIRVNRLNSKQTIQNGLLNNQSNQNLKNQFINNNNTIKVQSNKFNNQLNIMNNINNYNSNKSEFLCPTCGQDFTSRNSLHNHLATHNTSDLKLFMCLICNASFKTRKELSRHTGLHEFTKHKTCPECGETFKTSFHLKRHSLTRHSNIRPYKCNHCDMTFARKDKLKQHEAKHIHNPLYKCNECGKGFYRKEHLKDHEISKHSKQYPFTCENCNKGFVHAKDLHRHIRVRHLGNTSSNNSDKTKTSIENNKSTYNNYNDNMIKIDNSNNNNNNVNQAKLKQNKTNNNENQLNNKISNTNNPTILVSTSGVQTNQSVNDFKSKKISSILKSNLYLTNNNNNNLNSNTFLNTNNNNNIINQDNNNRALTQLTTPASSSSITPILLTNPTNVPINIINPTNTILGANNCQIISVRINDLNTIIDKLNNTNNQNKFVTNSNNNSNFKIKDQFLINQDLNSTNIQTNNQQNVDNINKKEITNTNPVIKSFKCNLCSKTFFYENHLKKHVLNKHSESSSKFSCSACNKTFTIKSSAKTHIENSHVEYQCPICLKSFKNKSHAQRHIDTLHSEAQNQNLMNSEQIKPIRSVKIDAKIIETSTQTSMITNNLTQINTAPIENQLFNSSQVININPLNTNQGVVFVQNLENINNIFDTKVDLNNNINNINNNNNNNNNNMINFNFDRQPINYSNLQWNSIPTSSASTILPLSNSVSQSPINSNNQATNFYIINNNNNNSQQQHQQQANIVNSIASMNNQQLNSTSFFI